MVEGRDFYFEEAAVRGKNLSRSLFSAEYGNSQSRLTLPQTILQKRFIFYQGFPKVFVSRTSSVLFLENWKKLTNDPSILEFLKGYQIPLLSEPLQKFSPLPWQKCVSGDRENVKERCNKNCLTRSIHFVNSIFLVFKKESGHRPIINLKNLNQYIHCTHFRMKSLFRLREILQEGYHMCTI